MRMTRGFPSRSEDRQPVVASMGSFDGMHLGHQALVARVREGARLGGLSSCIVTFFPHPLRVLAPERAPAMLQTLEDRLEVLERLGIDEAVVVPFTLELAAVQAGEFVRDMLLDRVRVAELISGPDARFGCGREGDVTLLKQIARSGAFELHVVDPVCLDGERISSSGLRRRVLAGDVEWAGRRLGRPYSMAGEVVKGDGRGTGLGFPTANLCPEGELRPLDGVYACRAELEDGSVWPAAVHVGPIPTFSIRRPTVEAHLIGFSGDLVGRRLRLHFVRRIRGTRVFDRAEALQSRIAEDVREAREVAG